MGSTDNDDGVLEKTLPMDDGGGGESENSVIISRTVVAVDCLWVGLICFNIRYVACWVRRHTHTKSKKAKFQTNANFMLLVVVIFLD